MGLNREEDLQTRMKKKGSRMIGKARKLVVAPLEKNELFKATKIEFAN